MSKSKTSYNPSEAILFKKEVRFHPNLTFGERVFLAEVQSLTKDGQKYPFSCKNLGEVFGVSHQTISNWVKKLVRMGLVDVAVDYANHNHKQFLVTK